MKTHYNIRSIAAKTLESVLEQGESLSAALPRSQATIDDRDKGLLQEICYGVLRVLPELNWYAKQLMSRPLEKKQRVFHYLLLVGFYQLLYMRIPPHAALSETVDGAAALKRPQLKGLINGVLRQFQRQQSLMGERLVNLDERYWHPTWLLASLKKAYPQQWKSIVDANNQRPPMWIRINPKHHDALAYQSLLSEQTIQSNVVEEYPQSLLLESPVGVDKLPDFLQGAVTVQDISAQRCINLLAPQDGELILDLCAAPGGKTTHLLEAAPKSHVIAVEENEERAKRIKENLTRLKQHAEVIVADGRDIETWRAGRSFDRILLDAPCSATGVIRRHPDIKWLRRETDIPTLVTLQKELLDAVWPHLKLNGVLLYATCSVLPQENSQQIEAFLAAHPDAKLELIKADNVTTANDTGFGLQVLPTTEGGDGFFYAKLRKIN